jgi:hypothetical protein
MQRMQGMQGVQGMQQQWCSFKFMPCTIAPLNLALGHRVILDTDWYKTNVLIPILASSINLSHYKSIFDKK